MIKNLWLIPICLCGIVTVSGQDTPKASPELAVVHGMVKAFNAHDVSAMLAFAADDIAYLSLSGNGIAVEAEGRDALAKGMESYFAAIPSVRSEIVSEMVSGPYVIFRERAVWKAKDGERSQSALAVYEVRDGKVKRVWYYPAERE